MRKRLTLAALASVLVLAAGPSLAQAVRGRTVEVDGLKLFYREAGSASAPTIVLLHGNPSSSFMFRDLIPRLAGRFHVIAPDYPGFGYSDTPSPETYPYSFEKLAETTDHLLSRLGARRYILYLQDYGGPVGFRLALAHPNRVEGLILQNANAYVEGLSPEWRAELEAQIKAAAQHPAPKPVQHKPPSPFAENLKWVRTMYLTGARDPEQMVPDGYTLDAALLSRPGQDDIQDALDGAYYTNVLAYPAWQAWLRRAQPRTLIVWGRGDRIFGPAAARAYMHDLPNARLVLYDGGHFVLEEHAAEVAREIAATFSRPAPRK